MDLPPSIRVRLRRKKRKGAPSDHESEAGTSSRFSKPPTKKQKKGKASVDKNRKERKSGDENIEESEEDLLAKKAKKKVKEVMES